MLYTALLLFASMQDVSSPSAAPDDLVCAAAMIAYSDPTKNVSADQDARNGASMALQFFLGRLTALQAKHDWVKEVLERAHTLGGSDTLRIAGSCLGRKAMLLSGEMPLGYER